MKSGIRLCVVMMIGFALFFAYNCKKDENLHVPVITTNTVSDITPTTATCGGNITSDGGIAVTTRGVCWSNTSNPTIANSKTNDGAGAESFVSNIPDLIPNTAYFVRAYASNIAGTGYGNELSFKTKYEQVTDASGNVYNTVIIGTQVWMAENLKTTKYNDGTDIPLVTDIATWAALSTPGYCWYNNDEANYKTTYGALYNWYTVNTGKLCPSGWHVPTDSEWKTLEMYLGLTQAEADAEVFRGTDQGTQLKNTTGWNSGGNGTNTSDFSALPGGFRLNDGFFNYVGTNGYWWSSTKYGTGGAWGRNLHSSYGWVYRYDFSKQDGFSVRCLRDF
jgi:uncharacterized protein (TIGR02145 family)